MMAGRLLTAQISGEGCGGASCTIRSRLRTAVREAPAFLKTQAEVARHSSATGSENLFTAGGRPCRRGEGAVVRARAATGWRSTERGRRAARRLLAALHPPRRVSGQLNAAERPGSAPATAPAFPARTAR